jgi:hypothetical protein
VPGFGARRQNGAAVAYVLFYRTAEGRQRWQTIGRHGAPWTPELAREEARRILGDVAKGTDPAAEKQAKRHVVTVAELCERYLADAESGRLLVRGGRGVATGTVGLLGAIFADAIDHHMRTDNPAHRVPKFAENRRERRLAEAEYATPATPAVIGA